MSNRTFATAINCIDGRVQTPVQEWLRKRLDVDYVDMITEPGADKALAEGALTLVEVLRHKVLISINAHNSCALAVVAHHDCAGNPVPKEQHLKHLRQALDRVKRWSLPIPVLGLWVDEDWQVEQTASD